MSCIANIRNGKCLFWLYILERKITIQICGAAHTSTFYHDTCTNYRFTSLIYNCTFHSLCLLYNICCCMCLGNSQWRKCQSRTKQSHRQYVAVL
ncbi:Uncharacterised protein [Segatella copri]|nr:Uncharacterised protein [Segatella copri]